MIRINNFGEEIYECSKCTNIVNEYDDECDVCGHVFNNTIDYSNKENKHQALHFTEGQFNGKEIMIATINNHVRGVIKFIVKRDSQIAYRVRFFILNNKNGFLEDELMDDKLINYENFLVVKIQNENYHVCKKLLEKKKNDSKLIKKINQKHHNNIYIFSEEWIDLNFSLEYKNALKECISYIRPEMYFYYLYRVIILYGFEKKSLAIPDSKRLLKIYEEASRRIMRDSCYFLLDKKEVGDEEYLSFAWENYFINYSKEVDLLRDSTLQFINSSKSIRQIIGIKENSIISEETETFFKYMMFLGLRIAYTRLKNESKSESYLGCEIIKTVNSSELFVYLTPKALRELTELLKAKGQQRLDIFNNFILNNNIERINSDTLRELLNTSIILKHESNLYMHYLQSPNHLNDYISQRINGKHISLIFGQCQANYKLVKM